MNNKPLLNPVRGVWRTLICLYLGLSAFPATAADPPGTDARVASPAPLTPPPSATLSEVVVYGDLPGPGLWRVSKDGHTLWILGTLSPLPSRMVWRSGEVEAQIGKSQELILAPTVKATVHPGLFGGILLLHSLIGVRDNPNDARLIDMVPADVYARWLVLKQKYLGDNEGVEKMRPMFAAHELYIKAVSKSGLSDGREIGGTVMKAAKHFGIPVVAPNIEIVVQQPRDAVKRFKSTPLEDAGCFKQTTEELEADLTAMRSRANAWATGDIDALQRLAYYDPVAICGSAYDQVVGSIGKEFTDVRGRLRAAWIAAVQAALVSRPTTFAVLPINDLLRKDGYLATLQSLGYLVEAPHSAPAAGETPAR